MLAEILNVSTTHIYNKLLIVFLTEVPNGESAPCVLCIGKLIKDLSLYVANCLKR